MQDWGSGPSSEDLEKKVIEIKNHLKNKFGPQKGILPILLVVLLVLVGGYSSMYEVDTEETGVVLRFGKFSTFAEPGLHFKLPFGIDQVYLAQTGRVLKEEFGFRTVTPDVRTTYTKKGLEEESLTLTGDLNVSDVEWIVQFQIADPFKFIFRIKDPVGTVRDIAEAMVRKAIGNANVNEVLTTERAQLAGQIEQNLQDTLNNYDIGVRIVTVKFQDVTPPDPVKAAFNEVNEAEQQKESLIFQAREQFNREVPRARGEAKQALQEAEGYAVERINKARGETNRFQALLIEYRKAPEVTRRRIHIETLEEVMPRLDEIYIMDEKGGGLLPLLPLRRIIPSAGKIDTSALLLMLLLQMAALGLIALLRGSGISFGALLILSLAELLGLLLNIFLFAILIQVIMSWINPGAYNPAVSLLYSLTEPVLGPCRRLLPPFSGIDLSPLVALIAIQLAKMLLLPPLYQLAN